MLDKKELILEGLAYTVMGILIVFMILVIIMLVIKAMALLSEESKPKAKKQQAKKQQTSLVQEEEPVVEPVEIDDSELIAVITAAIAATMGQSSSGFVVRSYKAVSGNVWNKAGRMDILENRL